MKKSVIFANTIMLKVRKIMIKLYFILIIVFLGFPNLVYAVCIEGDCINGKGTYTYGNRADHEGNKYVGEWKEGRGGGTNNSTC